MATLSPAEKKRMRQVIIASILSTDMSKHFGVLIPAVKTLTLPLASPHDKDGTLRPETAVLKERDKLHEIFLHAADLGGQLQPWPIAEKWSDAIVAEFRAQAQMELTAHVPITPHMHNIDSPLEAAELQSGFCDYVLAPLWRAMADVFPALQCHLEQLEANSATYKEIVAAERAARAKAAELAQAAAIADVVSPAGEPACQGREADALSGGQEPATAGSDASAVPASGPLAASGKRSE